MALTPQQCREVHRIFTFSGENLFPDSSSAGEGGKDDTTSSTGGSRFLHTRCVCVQPCKHTFKNVYVGWGWRRTRHTRLHKAQVFSVRPWFLGLYPQGFQETDIPSKRVPPLCPEEAVHQANFEPPFTVRLRRRRGFQGHRRTRLYM